MSSSKAVLHTVRAGCTGRQLQMPRVHVRRPAQVPDLTQSKHRMPWPVHSCCQQARQAPCSLAMDCKLTVDCFACAMRHNS